jgi:hypothetical protein
MIRTLYFLRLPNPSRLASWTKDTPLWPLTARYATWWNGTLLYLVDYHDVQAHDHKSLAVALARVEMTRAGSIYQ